MIRKIINIRVLHPALNVLTRHEATSYSCSRKEKTGGVWIHAMKKTMENFAKTLLHTSCSKLELNYRVCVPN